MTTLTADVLSLPPRAEARPARVSLVQYRDGVELVLETPPMSPLWGLLLGFCSLAPMAAALVLPTEPALLLIAALGLLWTSVVLSRDSARRSLLAHGASETWLLCGATDREVRAGGLSSELVLSVEADGAGRHLRLFTASGMQDLGAAGRVSVEELATVRRFAMLSGIRVVGLGQGG